MHIQGYPLGCTKNRTGFYAGKLFGWDGLPSVFLKIGSFRDPRHVLNGPGGSPRRLGDFGQTSPRLTTKMAKWTHSGWESCTFLAILAQFFGVVPGGVSLSNIRNLQLSSSKVTSHWLDIVSSGRPPIVIRFVVCCQEKAEPIWGHTSSGSVLTVPT